MTTEFVGLPAYPGYTSNPVEAFTSVPAEGLLQIVAFMGARWHRQHCTLAQPPLLQFLCTRVSLPYWCVPHD